VPHYSALVAGRRQELTAAPPQIDYTRGMPADLGVMLNDSLGDCTCAGAGHARQVWTFNANPPMVAVPDAAVLTLYESACGYVPWQPNTDQGGIEQQVLTYWIKSGFDGQELTAFVEVDPVNQEDVRQAIFDCGLVYIGINVPAYLEGLEAPGSVWDVNPGADNSIVGGHCVILAGYDALAGTYKVISWGSYYTMTAAFFTAQTDEVYGLVDSDWVAQTGQTPAGLTVLEWTAQMQALQEQGT
jgi:hypothetical protein